MIIRIMNLNYVEYDITDVDDKRYRIDNMVVESTGHASKC